MSKVRVHQLAKELGMEPKELIARLEKIKVRGKKVQSSLDDAEVASLRASLAAAEKPQVHIGEEKVLVDRMITAEDADLGEVQAHEKVVERRVQANVIRRRTSRVDVATQKPLAKPESPPVEPEETSPPPPSTLTTEPVSKEPEPVLEEAAAPEFQQEAAPSVPAQEEEIERPRAVEAEAAPEEPPQETAQEAPGISEGVLKGPRILGRIDLRRETVEQQGGAEGSRGAAPGEKRAAPVERTTAQNGDAAEPTAEEKERSPKGVKAKKRIVRKQEVIELREREFRTSRGRMLKKKKALPGKEQKKTEITVPKASKRTIRMSEVVSVGDMAKAMGVKAGEVIKKLMGLGMMTTINQVLDFDTATLLAAEFDYQVESVAFDAETALEGEHEVSEPGEALQPRPPVVTIMGHVDHGKTSLLDAIRSTNVTEGEAGGITQHIGAYHVHVDGRGVTFLDTPGHAAFTAMRARGAKVTDIVVLVVAADDGVMPQTVEAINHARAAEVPIVVAVNKMDRPDANLERVQRGLADHGLVPETWGGETIFVPVSAKTREGIPQLLEMLLLQADILELKANPDKLARGAVIEAKLERGRGPVSTILVQEGTLKVGDPIVSGTFYGRVRAMVDDQGCKVESVSPAMPAEILGLQGVPQAGEGFSALGDEAKARQIAEYRSSRQRETELSKTSKVSLEEFYEQIKAGEIKELRVVVKADVHGSVEALTDSMTRLSTSDVKLRVIHGSVGGVTESDVLLAAASNAIVIGFNVRPEPKAAVLASQEQVDVRLYTIIYELIDDIRAAMEGLLEPVYEEEHHGRAQVREVFNVRGVGGIAGCYVSDGKIQRSNSVRLLRDQVVICEGKLASLKRFKDDVREVGTGYECGIAIDGFQDVKVGDVIEAFEKVPVARPSYRGAREGSHASAGETR